MVLQRIQKDGQVSTWNPLTKTFISTPPTPRLAPPLASLGGAAISNASPLRVVPAQLGLIVKSPLVVGQSKGGNSQAAVVSSNRTNARKRPREEDEFDSRDGEDFPSSSTSMGLPPSSRPVANPGEPASFARISSPERDFSSGQAVKVPAVKRSRRKSVANPTTVTIITNNTATTGSAFTSATTLESLKAPNAFPSSSSSQPPPPTPTQFPTQPKTKTTKQTTKQAKAPKAPKPPKPPKPEKRGAVFKSKCPQHILDRVDRVRTQRFFMVDRRRNGEELKEEFSVYTVVIGHVPRCDCPDATKGNHCKHILFIYLKVLQVSFDSGYWYQKALLTSELEAIFAGAPQAPQAIANQRIRDAYTQATGRVSTLETSNSSGTSKRGAKGKGKSKSSDTAPATTNRRLPGPEDDCPICYEGMHGVAESKLVFCEQCGNALHSECFGQWRTTATRSGTQLTCVYCRAKWTTGSNAKASGSGSAAAAAGRARVGSSTTTSMRISAGYLNLSGVAGLSPQRDTSSYYHGPRRGARHYGYQNYEDDDY